MATDKKLEDYELQPAPNGGWVLSARAEKTGYSGRMIGAYSTDAEMLGGLAKVIADARRAD